MTEYVFTPNYNVNANQHVEYYTWTTDPAGNPYMSVIETQEGYNTSASVMKQTNQTLD